MGQKDLHQLDRRAALLQAFDNMTDEAQSFALRTVQGLEQDYPRGISVGLRLVAHNGKALNFFAPASGR